MGIWDLGGVGIPGTPGIEGGGALTFDLLCPGEEVTVEDEVNQQQKPGNGGTLGVFGENKKKCNGRAPGKSR